MTEISPPTTVYPKFSQVHPLHKLRDKCHKMLPNVFTDRLPAVFSQGRVYRRRMSFTEMVHRRRQKILPERSRASRNITPQCYTSITDKIKSRASHKLNRMKMIG